VETYLKDLAWDSEHFGLPVAQARAADEGALAHALRCARERGVRLVYWADAADVRPSSALLAEYGGRLVDRKTTFVRDLPASDLKPDHPFAVFEYPAGPANERLCQLAVAAGGHSRFRADPRLPPEKATQLFEKWIDGSTRRTLANAVLVVSASAGVDAAAGMITLSARDGVGNIGLVAVAEGYRGQGLGSLLMAAAHRWMTDRNARAATVVTQGGNAPACRLYERCGYRVGAAQDYYHFWPLEGADKAGRAAA
jgi:GNAT superfamily N-acetyltransferase